MRRHLPVLIAIAAVATLSACSSDSTATTSTASTTTAAPGGSQALPPVMVDLTTADGTTVEVTMATTIVFPVDDVTAWSATIADPSVVGFTAGKDDGSAVFNPGLTPMKAGTTEVTLTDGTTTVTITVTVTD